MVSEEKRNLVEKLVKALNGVGTKRIKELFESIGCTPLAILETPRAGQIVDNMYGVEFPLPDYAVIYKGDLNNNYCKIFDFEQKEEIDILFFDVKGCKKGVQALVNELKERDAYEVVYRKDVNCC